MNVEGKVGEMQLADYLFIVFGKFGILVDVLRCISIYSSRELVQQSNVRCNSQCDISPCVQLRRQSPEGSRCT